MAAEVMSDRQKAEQRSENAGVVYNSFKEAGVGAVRALELNNISVGDTVTIPVDYKIYMMPISGTNNKAAKIITEEGKDFWIGCLTRSAQPVDKSKPRVFPKGDVVEFVQQYGSMDEAFNAMKGRKILFKEKEVVATEFGGDPRDVNVWTLVFA